MIQGISRESEEEAGMGEKKRKEESKGDNRHEWLI